MDTPTVADPGEITETADAAGVTFAWPAYKADAPSVPNKFTPYLLLCAVGWVVIGLFTAWQLFDSPKPFLVVWLFVWAAGLMVMVGQLLPLIRPVLPEHVRLETDRLSYYPGRGPDELRTCAELPNGKVVPVTPAPAAEVSKATVRGFTLDRVNDRQRLVVDTDGRRFEIGGCLTEAERAWLFAALQKWLGRPVVQPWSREARINKESAPS